LVSPPEHIQISITYKNTTYNSQKPIDIAEQTELKREEERQIVLEFRYSFQDARNRGSGYIHEEAIECNFRSWG